MDDNQFLQNILKKAGRLIAAASQNERRNISTVVSSPYTVMDRRVANFITQALKDRFPNDSIIPEDGENVRRDSGIYWVLDPIDGTIPFMLGVPTHMISLCKVVGDSVILAYAYNPVTQQMFYAKKGEGTYLNGVMCQVSKMTSLKRSHVVISQFGMEKYPSLIDKLRSQGAYTFIQEGLVYRSCMVAAGLVEATVQPILKKYESGTVQLLVEEAGGRVIDWGGESPSPLQNTDHIIIANMKTANRIQQILKGP